MRLKGCTALISGSAPGIGRRVAHGFALEGAAAIVINYPDEAQSEATESVSASVRHSGARAHVICADVLQETEVAGLMREAPAQVDRIDILVNETGIANSDPFETLQPETRDRVIRMHLRGTFLLTRAILPGMYA